MSLFSTLIRNDTNTITTSRDLDLWLRKQAAESATGIVITPETAMQAQTVYACVKLLGETIGQLPLVPYRRRADGKGRDKATDHWLWQLLMVKPNSWQTPGQWREMMQAHLALYGNCYSVMTRIARTREVTELMPIIPDRVRKVEFNQRARLVYTIDLPDGTSQDIPQAFMFHIPALAMNGVQGLSPIAAQKESMGLQLALTQHGGRLFKQGALLSGTLEHPEVMSEEAYDRLKASFSEEYTGLANSHKTILLEEGTKFNRIGMTSEDAQYLESRKFQRTEIAAIFNVPPHMIGDMERATFSNIEEQALEYLTYTMNPWFVRWEEMVALKLIPEEERDTLFVEFMVDKLLRGDFKTRMEGYRVAVGWGWMNRNEVRAKENMNPGPEELDAYLVPSNMVPADNQDTLGAPGNGNGAGGDSGGLGGRSPDNRLSRLALVGLNQPGLTGVHHHA